MLSRIRKLAALGNGGFRVLGMSKSEPLMVVYYFYDRARFYGEGGRSDSIVLFLLRSTQPQAPSGVLLSIPDR